MERKNKKILANNKRTTSRLHLVKIARESRKNRLDILSGNL